MQKSHSISSETMQYEITEDLYSSQCFGVPFVSLTIKERTRSLSYVTIAKTLTNALQNLNVNCVVCKHRLRDISVIHGLENAGFLLMGVGAKLHCVNNRAPTNSSTNHAVRVEPYEDAHLDLFTSLVKETKKFFSETHYYNSPYLDSKLADRFYTRWIMADVQGRCNKNFVALQDNRIVGFLTCNETDEEAKLDLIWVDESNRRKGIGKELINTLLSDIKPNELVCDAYISQKKALDLYLATGFEVRDIYAIYHKYLKLPTHVNP
jgi:ribosomal protein S18 acetylase RimI-like enzyme